MPEMQPLMPSFTLETECQVSCRGKDGFHGKLATEAAFDGKGLRPGDGGLLTPLTVGMTTAIERACLASAAKRCGGLSNVDALEPLSVKSGAWESSAKM